MGIIGRLLIRAALIACLAVPGVAGAATQVRIATIQGHGLRSPLDGRRVHAVPGIVTAVARNGFYLQDPDGDGDSTTSDAIFVYTHKRPSSKSGQTVAVSGRVREYRPGGRDTGNLTITEIHAAHVRRIHSPFKHKHVRPTVIGADGRLPPTVVISAEAWGGTPMPDGIHFYESLEGMLVRISDAQVIAPTDRYGEIWVVAERGANATGMNRRGGITVRDAGAGVDYNPERIQLDDTLLNDDMPSASVGDVLSRVTGVVSYAYGNYEVQVLQPPKVTHANDTPAKVAAADPGELSVATYNVDNLDPNDDDGDRDLAEDRFQHLAKQIVGRLGAPDIVALQEVQDSDGARKSRVTDAALTMTTLIHAIHDAGGPAYAWAGVAPQRGRDGGQPGGNIRTVFLYNPMRVTLAGGSHPGGAVEAARLVPGGRDLRLAPNPARVAPTAPAFRHSRKPLAALFEFRGRRMLMIDNHFTSRRGSSPLYGRIQPQVLAGARQRRAQAEVLRAFVAPLLERQPDAAVIVLGDFNDFAFAAPLRPLTEPRPAGAGLIDALASLPAAERYTYLFEGNGDALDHVFLSPALARRAHTRIVHLNTGAAQPASDHDPVLVRLSGLVVTAN